MKPRFALAWMVALALVIVLAAPEARAATDELVALSQRLFDAVAPGDRAVWDDGGKLLIVRGAGPARELLGFSDDVFFVRGTPGLYLFRRERGQVTTLLDRRKGNDLPWRRVCGPK